MIRIIIGIVIGVAIGIACTVIGTGLYDDINERKKKNR